MGHGCARTVAQSSDGLDTGVPSYGVLDRKKDMLAVYAATSVVKKVTT